MQPGTELRSLPAILAAFFVEKKNSETNKQLASTGLDIALLAVGVGEVSAAIKAYQAARTVRTLFRLTLAVSDFAVSFTDLACQSDDTELCNEWREISFYIQIGLLTVNAADGLESLIRRTELLSGTWFDFNSFRNATVKTPGIDNNSLTNLPKAFWNDAYKVTPPNGTSLKSALDDIVTNGDNLGAKTEMLVDDIMQSDGFKIADGKYAGENGVNGFDGVYYKGTLDSPTEIIIIESKQMSSSGSVSLSGENFNTGLPNQMSDAWIVYVAGKLDDIGKAEVSDMINNNFGILRKYVSAVDKSTREINFLRLGNY